MARIDPLTPKEIRKAVAAQLSARLAALYPTLKVYQGRSRPAVETDDPQINVFSGGNESSTPSAHIPEMTVTERVNVWASFVLPEGVDFDDLDEALADLVDEMEYAIKHAVYTSRLFVATFRRMAGNTTRKGVSTEGNRPRGHVEIEFRFERTEAWKPVAEESNPDGRLYRIEIEQQLAEHVSVTLTVFPVNGWATHDDQGMMAHGGDLMIFHQAGVTFGTIETPEPGAGFSDGFDDGFGA